MIAQRLIRQPAAQIAIAAWIVVHGVVLLIAGGRLPFDRPALAGIPFGLQVAAPTIGMIEVFFLMAVVYWLTRKRVIADIAARAPLRAVAGRDPFLHVGTSPEKGRATSHWFRCRQPSGIFRSDRAAAGENFLQRIAVSQCG
jgi:hypothetical protein